jgi:hypothetical protein
MSHLKNAGIMDDRRLENCERGMTLSTNYVKFCQLLTNCHRPKRVPWGNAHIYLALEKSQFGT